MPFETALLSYAGLACLALTSHRVRRAAEFETTPGIGTLRGGAAGALFLSAWSAVDSFGPHQGSVAFIGMLAAAGIPLTLLLSKWPRVGLLAGVGAFVVGFGMMSL